MLDYDDPLPEIGVGASYGHGWRKLWPNFLILFLIGIISFLAGTASAVFDGMSSIGGEIADGDNAAQGIGLLLAAWGTLLSGVWGVFFVAPLSYGVKFAYLKAARNNSVDVKDMFAAFRNYWSAVLANLLVGVIVVIGFILLIVPGIIFACKLIFTPYLVVDRKMKVIDAVQESWRLTNGYALTVFFVALLSVPIFFAGLLCFGVGVIVSLMWIKMAFASLYYAVSADDAAIGLEELRARRDVGGGVDWQ